MLERTGRRRMIRQGGREDANSDGEGINGIEEGEGEEEEVLVRKMSMIFSPYAPRGEVDFITEEGGIRAYGSVRLLEERGFPAPPSPEEE